MKNLLYTLLLVGTCISAFPSSLHKPCRISGELSGMKSDTLLVLLDSGGGINPMDTIITKNGKFDYSLYCQYAHISWMLPTDILLMEATDWHSNSFRNALALLTVHDEHAVIKGTLANCSVSGSTFYQPYNDMLASILPYKKKVDDALAAAKSEQEVNSALKELSDASLRYIRQHPQQESALYLLKWIAPSHRREAVLLFTESVRKGRMRSYCEQSM